MSLRRFALGATLASIGTLAIVMGAACAQEMSSVAEPPAQISPAIDKAFTALMAAPTIVKLLDSVKADHDRTVADMRMLTEIERHVSGAEEGGSIPGPHEGDDIVDAASMPTSSCGPGMLPPSSAPEMMAPQSR